jgi:hypothetical protein
VTRLKFHFTPLDSADFDVCAGPPRPAAPPSPPAEPATPADLRETDNEPPPAEG